jgi:hypothetical protein
MRKTLVVHDAITLVIVGKCGLLAVDRPIAVSTPLFHD